MQSGTQSQGDQANAAVAVSEESDKSHSQHKGGGRSLWESRYEEAGVAPFCRQKALASVQLYCQNIPRGRAELQATENVNSHKPSSNKPHH